MVLRFNLGYSLPVFTKPMILKGFGVNVCRRRKAMILTQEKLAEKADLHPTYVSGIERGVRNPTILSAAALASALKCSIADLCSEIETGGESHGIGGHS